MKALRILALAGGVLATSVSQADDVRIVGDVKFVADADKYDQLCLAALESKYNLNQKARELGISAGRIRQVSCNGMSIFRFADEYGQAQILGSNTTRLPAAN